MECLVELLSISLVSGSLFNRELVSTVLKVYMLFG